MFLGLFLGGEEGIRTLEPFYRLHDFQSCALDQTRRLLRDMKLPADPDGRMPGPPAGKTQRALPTPGIISFIERDVNEKF